MGKKKTKPYKNEPKPTISKYVILTLSDMGVDINTECLSAWFTKGFCVKMCKLDENPV